MIIFTPEIRGCARCRDFFWGRVPNSESGHVGCWRGEAACVCVVRPLAHWGISPTRSRVGNFVSPRRRARFTSLYTFCGWALSRVPVVVAPNHYAAAGAFLQLVDISSLFARTELHSRQPNWICIILTTKETPYCCASRCVVRTKIISVWNFKN